MLSECAAQLGPPVICHQEGNVHHLFSPPCCSLPCWADHSSELAALLGVTDPLLPCPVAETCVTTYEGQRNVLSLSRGPAQSLSRSSPPRCFLPAQARQQQAPVSREGAAGVASLQLFRWKHHVEKPSKSCGLAPGISTAFRQHRTGPGPFSLRVGCQSGVQASPGLLSEPCLCRT